MKHNSEWGNGEIVVRRNILERMIYKTSSGGVGTTLTGGNTFCLKLVSLMKSGVKADGTVTGEGELSEKFWQEAKSASLYYSVARNIPGCVACPVPPHYWIHENDTLFQDFSQNRKNGSKMRSLLDFIPIFDIQPQQLYDKGINPEEYWLVPEKLLKEIYEKTQLAAQAEEYLKKVPEKLWKKIYEKPQLSAQAEEYLKEAPEELRKEIYEKTQLSAQAEEYLKEAPEELRKEIYEKKQLAAQAEKYLKEAPELYNKIFNNTIKCNLLLTYPILKGERSLKGYKFDVNREIRLRKNSCSDVSDDDIRKELQQEEAREIRRMIYQVLSAILTLYRNGLAHCDIKPENIMWGRRRLVGFQPKNYFLTDIGGMHSSDLPSASMTPAYFDSEFYKKYSDLAKGEAILVKDAERLAEEAERFNRERIGNDDLRPDVDLSSKDLKELLIRTLMDGYALGLTIFDLANPDITPNIYRHGIPLNADKIKKAWGDEKIREIFKTLRQVRTTLTIADMQRIVDDLSLEFAADNKVLGYNSIIETYGQESEFQFNTQCEEKINDDITIEYGYLSEQLNISGRYNTMLRVSGKNALNNFSKLPREVEMQRLIASYTNGSKIFSEFYYAPDDVNTGSRVANWDKYIACTLAYYLKNNLDVPNFDDMLELGRVLDEYLNSQSSNNEKYRIGLPYPRDIVMVDGAWRIQPFFVGNFQFYGEFSVQEYFKMLCGRENKLTAENWADLLLFDRGVGILFELIPDNMAKQVAELVKNPSPDSAGRSDNVEWRRQLQRRYPHPVINRAQDFPHIRLSETEKFRKYFDDLPLDSVK